MLRVAIVGCGLIGHKRARALSASQLVAVADINPARAQQLAAQYPGCAVAEWQALVERDDIDLVIVATTNDALAPVSLAAVQHGKHLLVEKPAARDADEVRPLVAADRVSRLVAKAGFNHRF